MSAFPHYPDGSMEEEAKAAALAIRHPIRVELLIALDSGYSIDPKVFAEGHGLTEKNARYHFGVLVEVEAISIIDGRARITEKGKTLLEVSKRPERRTSDRRSRPRRKADWDQ